MIVLGTLTVMVDLACPYYIGEEGAIGEISATTNQHEIKRLELRLLDVTEKKAERG